MGSSSIMLRKSVSLYTWFSVFFVALIVVFAVVFQPAMIEPFWGDRMWYLAFLIPFSGIIAMLHVEASSWRFYHMVMTIVLTVLFFGLWITYLVPMYIAANNQPDELPAVDNIGQGGTCGNPFNALAWYCIYDNTYERKMCPTITVDPALCTIGFDAATLPPRFAHFWLFGFAMLFIVFGVLDLVLVNAIHNVVEDLHYRDAHDADADMPLYTSARMSYTTSRRPSQSGVQAWPSSLNTGSAVSALLHDRV